VIVLILVALKILFGKGFGKEIKEKERRKRTYLFQPKPSRAARLHRTAKPSSPGFSTRSLATPSAPWPSNWPKRVHLLPLSISFADNRAPHGSVYFLLPP